MEKLTTEQLVTIIERAEVTIAEASTVIAAAIIELKKRG